MEVGIVSFGKTPTVIKSFNDQMQSLELTATIDSLPKRLRSKMANLGRGLKMIDNFWPMRQNQSQDFNDHLVIILDKGIDDFNRSRSYATDLRKRGIKLHALGISSASKQQLTDIVSSPVKEYLQMVPSYKDLDSQREVLELLVNSIIECK